MATNEELVMRIRHGESDCIEHLYKRNLPLIKMMCAKYSAYEEMDDLMQEAYFGLIEAVKHYDDSEEVPFMNYARYWIKQAILRYIDTCGSAIRLPEYKKQLLLKYKKCVSNYIQEKGYKPTVNEISRMLGMSIPQILEIQASEINITSLDMPVVDDDNMSLKDTIESSENMEENVIDSMYREHEKKVIWDAVNDFTEKEQRRVIIEYFKNKKSISQIAREQNISVYEARKIRNKGIANLRRNRAIRILETQLERSEARSYRGGIGRFERTLTSITEEVAIDRFEYVMAFGNKVSLDNINT